MPFTLSHAVVALPFRRGPLPAVGVAAGAMAPDLPLFVPIGATYDATHALWAAPTLDVLLGLLLLVLWGVVLRPALVAVAPAAVAGRLPAGAARPSVPRPTPALLGALAVGALTHVVWDAFTHRRRWGTQLLPVIAHPLAGVPLTSWFQHASTALGLLLLTGAGIRSLAGATHRGGAPLLPTGVRRAAQLVVLAALLGGAVVAGASAAGDGVAAAALAAATAGVDAAGAVLLVLGVLVGLRARPA